MIKGGLGNLMKQAQQMQENMQKMQDKLAEIEVQGQAASGMVKITIKAYKANSPSIIAACRWLQPVYDF